MVDTDLIERLKFHGRYVSETQAECTERKNAERVEASERIAALVRLTESLDEERRNALDLCVQRNIALAEQDARIVELELLVASKIKSVRDITIEASRAECEGLRAIVRQARELLAGPLVGVEWKRACHDFIATADAALSQKETGRE